MQGKEDWEGDFLRRRWAGRGWSGSQGGSGHRSHSMTVSLSSEESQNAERSINVDVTVRSVISVPSAAPVCALRLPSPPLPTPPCMCQPVLRVYVYSIMSNTL